MRIRKTFILVLVSACLVSLNFSLQAEQENQNVTGNFSFGYRYVDNSGALQGYKQDINLDDGLRLFNFNLKLTPANDLKKLFDRIDVNMYNFGGDPFETLSISAQKYGLYKFQYNRRKSTYFYADQRRDSGNHFFDFHSLDFERVTDSGTLKVNLGKGFDAYLNFDQYTKTGDSITTFDINRIEFEFDKPVREKSKRASIGLTGAFKGFSFTLEQNMGEYDNENSLFLPGYMDGGESARYPSSLDYFFINQPYEIKSSDTSVKVTANPFRNLLISGSALLTNQDLDLSYSEGSQGVDYLNWPFSTSHNGEGSFERKMQLYDLDVTYSLFHRLAIIGAVRYSNFDQEGDFTIDGAGMPATLKYETMGYESGLQFQFSPKITLTAGYRNEERKLKDGLETVDYEDKTTRNGFFGNLNTRFSSFFKMDIDYQLGTYENPFTRVSPSDLSRFRTTAKLTFDNLSFSGSLLMNNLKNDLYDFTWESDKTQFNLRAGYHGKTVTVFAGYGLINIEYQGDRTISFPPSWSGPGSFPWDIHYEGKSNLLDAMVSVNLDEDWRIGGYANSYSNTGSWEISRTNLKAFLEYLFTNGIVTEIGYRYVNFKENDSGYNDYKANIVEISFGYRWK